MAQKRLSMRKIREALRQRHELGRSHREIARSLSVSHSTVREYMRRAEEAGVSWPVPADWDDERLESALFPRLAPSTVARPEPVVGAPGTGSPQGRDASATKLSRP